MGKKDGKNKRKRDEEPAVYDINNDPELEAELEAVAAMRAEKARRSDPNQSDSGKDATYNKEGLLMHIGMSESMVLPFVETMVVSDYSIVLENENEDLEREVRIVMKMC